MTLGPLLVFVVVVLLLLWLVGQLPVPYATWARVAVVVVAIIWLLQMAGLLSGVLRL